MLPILKRWVGTISRNRSRWGKGIGWPLQPLCFNLPMELIIEVALISGCSSQQSYRTFCLVSKQFRSIMERECLPHLPIQLESAQKIIAFHKMIALRPELALRVRHLWIRGAQSRQNPKAGYSEPTPATWRQFKASAFEQLRIIHSCINLVSLACSFPVMFVCFRFTKDVFFKHNDLTELTLFENWNLWPCFGVEPPVHGPHLFLQLTHLMILDSVAPCFPAGLFPALKCFSAEMNPGSRQEVLNAFKSHSELRVPLNVDLSGLKKDIDITLHMMNAAELGVKKMVGEDTREWSMKVGAPRHFEWWAQRISGGQGVWALQ